VEKLPPFFRHPGFIAANRECLEAALERLPRERRDRASIFFTAHGIPLAMARGCEYERQLSEVAGLVSEGLSSSTKLVYQSRSGPPTQPWLEPDLLDAIRDAAAAGTTDLVLAPIGFVSDHMEVVYDLDVEARSLAQGLGVNLVRAATSGSRPRFVKMVAELVEERLDRGRPDDECAPDCCPRESA
jgi:protoporphyrin/coproporphyrin ferrochelatase